MKALMVVTEKLPVPPVRGGAIQTYVAGVAPYLAREHNLTILGVTDPLLPDRERSGDITYVRAPGGDLETYQQGVAAFLLEATFDLIHVYNRPRLIPVVRAGAPESRIILSMHNDMFLPTKIDPVTARHAIAEIERIVTVSDYVGRTIATAYPEAAAKIQTIYSGVDLDRFAAAGSIQAERYRTELREAHGLVGKNVILFVGRLSPKKGADILVRAMHDVAPHHPDAALVLVGSKWYGEDRVSDYVAYVRSLAARCPIPVVTTGFVPADQVHRWFAAGDIFVCASQWEEPLARVHYEAMAAGLPIITTARGGNAEVMEGQGNGVLLTHPEEPSAFADAINGLLANDKRRTEMGAQGRRLAEAKYGWDRVARELKAVWK